MASADVGISRDSPLGLPRTVRRRDSSPAVAVPSSYVALEQLTPAKPQAYRFTAIVNAGDDTDATVERTIAPGELQATERPLGWQEALQQLGKARGEVFDPWLVDLLAEVEPHGHDELFDFRKRLFAEIP